MIAKIVIVLFIILKVTFATVLVSDKEYASMPLLFHQDNYDHCMLWEDEAFYCNFEFILEPIDTKNVTQIWRIIQNVSSDFWSYNHDNLRHWICVKETCPDVKKSHESDPALIRDLEKCYNKKYTHLNLKGSIRNLTCEDREPKYPIDWVDISCGLFVAFYLCFVVYATCYEGLASYQPEEVYEKITASGKGRVICSFSVVKNWKRLTTVNISPDFERLRSIQGIRVYNMSLVVLEHTVMSFLCGPITNTHFTENMHNNIVTLFLSSGPLCVGTFYMLSAFLLTYGLFEHFKNSKEIKPKFILLAMLNRFIRLTPTLLFVLLLHATWLRHFGMGPNWNNLIGEEYLRCRENWWTNVLYLNNWIRGDRMCLQTTWYMALDTQYFAILLVIIWAMKKYENKIWLILGSVLTVVTLGTFWENYLTDFDGIILPTAEKNYNLQVTLGNKQWTNQMCSFIGNLGGPVIGMGLGYICFKYKNQKIFNTKLKSFLWHAICYGGGFGICLIPGYIYLRSNIEHDHFWSSVHVAISRPIFATSIGLSIIGTAEGTGKWSKYVMEWSPTYILGRLSYSAYLIHMSLTLGRAAMNRGPIYISEYAIMQTFFGDLAMTYLCALMLTLTLELPVSQLQKLMIPSKKDEKIHDSKKK